MATFSLFSNPNPAVMAQPSSGPNFIFGSQDRGYQSLLNGSELNESDSMIEGWYDTITTGIKMAKDLITERIITALKGFITSLDGILPIIVHLSSSLVNFITHITYITISKSDAFFNTVSAVGLITSFASFITSLAQLFQKTPYRFDVEAATAASRQAATELASDIIKSNSTTGITANSMKPESWVKIAIGAIVSVLFSGMGLTKIADWKNIILGADVLDRAKKTTATVSELSQFILKEVVGMECDEDYAVCRMLEDLANEGAVLQQLPPAHYIQHPDDFIKLQKFAERIIKATTMKLSKDMTPRYNTIKQLLIQMYKILCDKLDAVNAILQSKKRQVTVGFLISGEHGIGKSEFCHYLAKKVAEQLGYNPAMYSLHKRADGFFEPYGGNEFGIFDEWMSLRSDDPLLRDFNLVLSSDPMNFEGAALDCKVQPCKLKVVFLTANSHNPDLTNVLTKPAAEAAWDRIYHIRMEDPKCEGRNAPNLHRKPDFSHCTFTRVDHSNLKIMDGPDMQVADIISRLVGRCAKNEHDFNKTILTEELEPSIASDLQQRQEQLQTLLRTNLPYDLVPNYFVPHIRFTVPIEKNGFGREFFCVRFQGALGSGKSTMGGQIARDFSSIFGLEIQKSEEQSEFIVDKSKPKIYFMDDWIEKCDYQAFLEKINQTHPQSMFIICSNTVFKPIRANYSLASCIDRFSSWYFDLPRADPLDATQFAYAPGVLRRIGLQGAVRMSDGTTFQTNEYYQKTFTCETGFITRDRLGQQISKRDILNVIFEGYKLYLSSPSDLFITRALPPAYVEPDCKITADTLEDLISTLKSTTEIGKAFFGRHPKVSLNLTKTIMQASRSPGGSSSNSLSMWHIPKDTPETVDSAETIFSAMCTNFERSAPKRALHIHITSTGQNYYYYNNIAYIYTDGDMSDASMCEAFEDYIIFHRGSNDARRISIHDFIAYHHFKQFPPSIFDLDFHETLVVDRYISSIVFDDSNTSLLRQNYIKFSYEAQIYNSANARLLTSQLRAHPLFWVGCGLLAMAATYGLYWLVSKLYNWYYHQPETPETRDYVSPQTKHKHKIAMKDPFLLPSEVNSTPKPKENTWDPSRKPIAHKLSIRRNEGTFDHTRHLASKHLKVRRNQTEEKPIEEIKLQPDLYIPPHLKIKADKVASEISRIIPNSEEVVRSEIENYLADDQDSDPYLSCLTDDQPYTIQQKMTEAINLFGKDLSKTGETPRLIHQNMLSSADMIEQSQTTLKLLHSKLNKFYFQIKNMHGGKCYGIGLFGKFILTVGHMFEHDREILTIYSDGVAYPASVLVLDRARDLAVVHVDEKSFPSIPNTVKYFQPTEQLEEALYGFFIRCGPECQIMAGYVSYHENLSYPLTDSNSETMKLSDKLVLFCAIGLHRVRAFIQRGDCGFPVVTETPSGQFKISGIHNAFADSEKCYFSSFTAEDHKEFLLKAMRATQNSEEPIAPMEVVSVDGPNCDFLLPRPYCEALEDIYFEERFVEQQDKLDILGYSPKLSIRSRPALKATHIELPGMQSPDEKCPAAFNMDYVTDTSKLVTSSDGRADPLFTQCVKYDKNIQCKPDPDIYRLAEERVIEDTYLRYGDCRFLRKHEVLNGIKHDALVGFDPTTSAGPLLKMLYNIQNKLPILDAAPDKNSRVLIFKPDSPAAQMVQGHYEQYIDSLFSGGPPPLMISKDCAKVELINAVKAKAGKVRLFNEIDISINMVLKKIFGDLQNRVIARHESNPIKMGQNPYRTSTTITLSFHEIDGEIVSTDFSAFDKTLPAQLIRTFTKAAAKCYHNASPDLSVAQIEVMFEKIALTLTWVVHTCRGTVYLVNRGNESGTFVTTLMNSVCVRTLTFYSLIKKWHNVFRFTPSLNDLLKEHREAIFGDDRTLKTSRALPLTQADLIKDSLEFGMTCTSAKTIGDIDFCSRSLHWDERFQVSFPALKEESIYALLRWFKSTERSQILDNIENCLFEAALHPQPEIHEIALHDALLILKHFNIDPTTVEFTSRDLVRGRFISYVRQNGDFEWLTHHSEQDVHKDTEHFDSVYVYQRALTKRIEKLESSTENTSPDLVNRELKRVHKYLSSPRTAVMPDPAVNPVSAVLEALQACKVAQRPVEGYEQLHDGRFRCITELLGQTCEGVGSTKREAKSIAYRALFGAITNELQRTRLHARPNMLEARAYADRIGKRWMYKSIDLHLGLARRLNRDLDQPVIVLAEQYPSLKEKERDGIRYHIDQDGVIYLLSETAKYFKWDELCAIYNSQPGTAMHGLKIFVGVDDTTQNSVPPQPVIGGSLVQDTASNPGLTTIPHLDNVVPVVETVPATLANAPPTQGAFEPLLPYMNLNPSGPPNMLSAGAIAFDIKDLVYNQFIDCDEMFIFTDDTTDGQIVFQIPYDPFSKFVNKYARGYVEMHERFAGELDFRFTVVGNQTFSGYVYFCWQPHKVTTANIQISEAMKYNYIAQSIASPTTCVFSLSDARQDKFWRMSTDTDVDSRPHLVCFVGLTAQSPLKEGIRIRIRIASKLSDSFQVANPVIAEPPTPGPPTGPEGTYSNNEKRLWGLPIVPTVVRPIAPDAAAFHLIIDGSTFAPICEVQTSDYTLARYPTTDMYPSTLQGTETTPPGTIMIWETSGGDDRTFLQMCNATKHINMLSAGTRVVNKGIEYTLSNALYTNAKAMLPNPESWHDELLDNFMRDTGATYYVRQQILKDVDIAYQDGSPGDHKRTFKQSNIEAALFYYPDGMIYYSYGILESAVFPESILYGMPQNSFEQLQEIKYKDGAETMPSGWRHLAITPDLPFVAPEAQLSSYTPNHISLYSLIESLEANIASTQCLQVTVSDYESATQICTFRYLPDRKYTVINLGTASPNLYYATSLRPCERMYVSEISIVERGNVFPETTVQGNFVDNQIHPDVKARKYRKPKQIQDALPFH